MARVEDDECAVTFELNESDLPTSLRFNEVSAAEHAGAAPESEEEGACGGSGTAGVQRPLGTRHSAIVRAPDKLFAADRANPYRRNVVEASVIVG